jgi:hypothetical protein
VTNGLLLRADIHNLFDIGLLWVTDTYKVQVDPTLRSGEYRTLHGKKLRLPGRQVRLAIRRGLCSTSTEDRAARDVVR